MASSRAIPRAGLRAAALVLALLSGAAGASAQHAASGYVWDLQGTWITGADTLRPGQRVAPDDSVRLVSEGDELAVLVLVLESGRRVRLVCDVPAACAAPILPADSVRGTPFRDATARLVRAVAALISAGGREDTIRAVVRGSGFREAVILRDDEGTVDLAPVFAGHEAGRFSIAIHAEDPGPEGAGRGVHRANLSWEGRGRLPVEGLAPRTGLHRLAVSRVAGPFAPTSEVLVLIAGPDAFPRLSEAFAEALEVTGNWRDASETERRRFLRLWLRHLAAASEA